MQRSFLEKVRFCALMTAFFSKCNKNIYEQNNLTTQQNICNIINVRCNKDTAM